MMLFRFLLLLRHYPVGHGPRHAQPGRWIRDGHRAPFFSSRVLGLGGRVISRMHNRDFSSQALGKALTSHDQPEAAKIESLFLRSGGRIRGSASRNKVEASGDATTIFLVDTERGGSVNIAGLC